MPPIALAPKDSTGSYAARPTVPRPRFQKSYQACEHCRKRKVRCVLDTSSKPGTDRCVQCRRQRKKCVFSAERSVTGSLGRTTQPTAAVGSSPSGVCLPDDASRSPMTLPDARLAFGPTRPVSPSPSAAHSPASTSVSYRADSGLTSTANGLGFNNNTGLAREIEGSAAQSNNKHNRSDSAQIQGADKHHALDLLLDIADSSVVPVEDSSSPGLGPGYNWCTTRHPLSNPSQDVLDTWQLCPFVKSKWLTAREAVTYVDLFYQNLAPLSLILDNSFKDHASHHRLITSNRFLCSTLLTISTRYHFLSGPASLSRGFLLHEKLWAHCQSLLQNMIWGRGTRTKSAEHAVEAIESILLLSEWHPRSFHSGNLGNESGLEWPEEYQPTACQNTVEWYERVVEPIRAMDRTSWMMLGCAVALSNEHGLSHTVTAPKQPNESENQDGTTISWQLRTHRSIRLLFVYINQLASRVGCAVSKIPFHSELREVIYYNVESVEAEWHDTATAWIDLSRLGRSASDLLFPTGASKTDLLQNARYRELLQHFQDRLLQWKNKYASIPGWLSPHGPLQMEYQYLRIYVNSISLQAVSAMTSRKSNATIQQQFEVDAQDSSSIREVLDGCREIFHAILRLNSTGQLRYIPNRISFKTASVLMYFVKALATGLPESEFMPSLNLLHQTLASLRSDAVDDAHISAHYASILDTHVKSLRKRFLAISNPVVSDISRAPSSFEPCAQTVRDVTVSSDAVNDALNGGFDSWMVLPFDPFVSEPLELAFMQDIYGVDVGDISSSFWELLP